MNASATIDKYVYFTKAIGKGAYSKVYKGFNTITDEIVAIKIIEKSYLKPKLIELLNNEVSLLRELEHDNIVELRDYVDDNDNFYLILEYCAGGDLANLIRKGRIPEDISRDYMRQISSALRYLKSRNIIHRDLKPQNILLDSDKKIIKLTDFNFARELYDNDLAQTLCGSPLYMAPEILKKCEYSVKSDLWSVGLILYEMVYGINPYRDAISEIDLFEKITKRQVNYDDTVSSDCNNLLRGLIERDPDKRLSWNDFFNHPWLNLDEPIYLPVQPDNVWESVILSDISKMEHAPQTKPISINSKRFNVDVVDDYIPLGITPPRYSQSEPIYHIEQIDDPISNASQTFKPSSAPEKSVVDHFWNYMSSSVNIIKGAVDYISSTTNK